MLCFFFIIVLCPRYVFSFFRGKTAFLIIAFQRLFVQTGMPAAFIHTPHRFRSPLQKIPADPS